MQKCSLVDTQPKWYYSIEAQTTNLNLWLVCSHNAYCMVPTFSRYTYIPACIYVHTSTDNQWSIIWEHQSATSIVLGCSSTTKFMKTTWKLQQKWGSKIKITLLPPGTECSFVTIGVVSLWSLLFHFNLAF